jgi:hypothetical protein
MRKLLLVVVRYLSVFFLEFFSLSRFTHFSNRRFSLRIHKTKRMTKRDPGGRKRSLKLANEIRRQQKDDDDFGPSGGGGGGGGGVGKREAKDTNDDDAGGGWGGAKSSFEGLIAPHAMKKATKKAKFLESASRF